MNTNSQKKSMISTVIVMGCTLISRILGFVRTAVIGAYFGVGGAADAINLVFNIPNNLRKLLAEGALSTAFIPELSQRVHDDVSGLESRRLLSSLLGLQLLILIPILLLSELFPKQVLFLFEQFSDPEKAAASQTLLRWMIPYIFPVSISALIMAVLNTHGKFFIPALSPIFFSLFMIGIVLVFHSSLGVKSVGIGVLVGGMAQLLVQIPLHIKLGYNLIPNFNFRNPSFLRVLKKWGAILLTSSLFAINNQVAMLLASFLPDKSVSSITYAIVFFQLPFGLFSASINTVLYPKMSRQAAKGDTPALMKSLGVGYKNLFALLTPSAMVLILLGAPIIALSFQRRAFTLPDTILTARVLSAYALGMPAVGIFTITQRANYAIGNVKQPFFCAFVTILMDIVFSLLLIFFVKAGPESLAWANTFAFTFGAILQYILFRNKSGFRIRGDILNTFGKVLFSTGIGALFIIIFNHFAGLSWWTAGINWKSIGFLMFILFAVSVLILLFYFWMKIEIMSILFKRKGQNNEN